MGSPPEHAPQGDAFVGCIRICLQIRQMHRRKHRQRDLSGDAVPVGLGVRRGHMPALGGVVRVADADGDGDRGGILQRRQPVAVGGGQTVTAAQFCAVDPQPGHAGTFQGQQQRLMQILRGRGEGGLVPCPAGEGVALGEVAGIPRCIIGTLFRLGSGAGQWNGIRQDGGEELLPNAVFVRIHGEAPDAREVILLVHGDSSILIKSHCHYIGFPGNMQGDPAKWR